MGIVRVRLHLATCEVFVTYWIFFVLATIIVMDVTSLLVHCK